MPTADHYPRLKMHGGLLTPDNAMLGKRMSLEEIADQLNVKKVPTIHGTNRWTAPSVRKAFVS